MTSSEKEIVRAFAVTGNKEQALSLLSLFADPSKVKDMRGSNNRSLLHEAARRGWVDVIEMLVTQYKCDPYCETSDGTTLLYVACLKNFHDVVRYLISEFCMDPLKKKQSGETPLDRSTGETKQYLQELLDDATKQGFESVVDYLKKCREQKYQSAFAEAMNEGGGELYLSNIILHGPPGAGKSSVKRLILGQPPLPKCKQNATDILESAVRAVCVDRVAVTAGEHGRSMEVVTNSDQIIERLAGEVEHHRKKLISQHIPSPPTPSPIPSLVPVTHPAVETPSKSVSLVEESIKEMVVAAKTSSRMFGSRWHHYVDSGGQPQFLEVLPLLYRSPSHFIVVMRLTEGLDEKPKVRFYNQGKDLYELPDHLVLTNREMIIQMCQVARRIAQATKGKFIPRVFVVGTRKDKLLRIAKAVKLKIMNAELQPIHKQYDDVLIPRSPEEVIISVNSMAEGREREQYTDEIRQLIQSATANVGDPIRVPVKWLTFHLKLDKGKGVVRMPKCYDMGKELGLEKNTVCRALEFLHQAALILYYPDADLVLTKMDPFTNRLSHLIKASFIPPDGPTRESAELRKKGVFEKSFLKRAFGGLKDSLLSDEEFLKLLVSLKIAVHIGREDISEKYFLPSALALEPPHKGSSFDSGSVPLALWWGDLILPHGFFLTVAVELLEKLTIKDNFVFELCTHIDQWRGEIQVSETQGRIPGAVKLTDRKKWIQVSYSSENTYCRSVRKLVDGATQRAIKRFQHTGIDTHKIGYLCTICKKKDHYCYLSHDQCIVTCSMHAHKTGKVTSGMSCWIEETTTSISSTTTLPSTTSVPFPASPSSVPLESTTSAPSTFLQPTISLSANLPHTGDNEDKGTPELNNVHRLLKPKAHKWDAIGRHLQVDYGFRESLLKQGVMRDDDSKLEAVLNKWIESQCSPVSWDNLIQVLKTDLKFVDIADNVETYIS